MLASTVAACAPTGPSPSLLTDRSAAGLQQMTLDIHSGAKVHRFIAEVARSPQEQETGLMNRPSLSPDRGMIFPYDPPQPVAFWMKNTLIPLDMIFIRPDGSITKVAANTVPLSLEPVPAAEPIAAVLEIPGGRSAELGIHSGDTVNWPH
jgi:uncharacterized membrane protein (UPF0127 family)